MSHSWHYRCKECDDYGPDVERGCEQLQDLWAAWPHLKKVKEAFTQPRSKHITIELNFQIWELERDSGELLEFLEQHDGHPMVVKSEYSTVAPVELKAASD